MNRRQFVKAAGLVTLIGAAPRTEAFAVVESLEVRPVVRVAFADPRYSDCRTFGVAAFARGAAVLAAGGDLGTPWFDEVVPRVAAHRLSIAGLTLESDLFVLERLAAEAGLSLRYVGMHDWRLPGPAAQHELSGVVALDSVCAAFEAGGTQPWQPALVQALYGAGLAPRQRRSFELATSRAPDAPSFLTSWLIG